MYWGNYTTANEEKQSAFPIRSDYPDRQGRVVFFRGREKISTLTLDRLDFCRCHFAAENGEQDLTILPPVFVCFILTAKPSALVRRLPVGFAVALPPRPRPLPKNRIRANAYRRAWTFRLAAQPPKPHEYGLSGALQAPARGGVRVLYYLPPKTAYNRPRGFSA